jgi:sulfate adenylyltransferase subunit 2
LNGKILPVEILNERRRLAVKLRLSGMKVADVAHHAELSAPTVIAAHRAYLAGGWEAVTLRPRGRRSGEGRLLTAEQEGTLIRVMGTQTPEHLGLQGRAWTAPLLQAVIGQRLGLDVGPRTLQRYLERWGFRAEHPAEAAETPCWIRLHTLRLAAHSDEGTLAEIQFLVAHPRRAPVNWLPKLPGGSLTQALIDLLLDNSRLLQTGGPLVVATVGLDPFRSKAFGEWLAGRTDIEVRPTRLPATLARLDLPAPVRDPVGTAIPGPLSSPKPARPSHRKPAQSSAPPAPRILTPLRATEKHPVMKDSSTLTHLQRLEAESIHIMREVVAEAENPVMLYSIGKDSAVMLHLATKAFYPSKPPFPLLHVDTTWKFQAMYAFRDRMAEELGMDLLVHINPDGIEKGINPFTHGSAIHTDIMKTEGLKQALDKYGFDAAFGGARRDEEKSRAKERVFSFRSAAHRWDPKNQRPELWKLYNARKHKGESIRVFPLSNWTELDIWQYIYLENVPIVPLYYSAVRPVVERDGTLIMVDDDRMPLKPGEVPMMKKVRFRTLGCYPLTGAVESEADTLPAIIQEMLLTKTSERQGRVIDHDSAASMEKKKQEGYF